jgi:LmbE family N-acetylglucosaminyl deacetylase
MKLHLDTAEIYVPDGMAEAGALARTTHLAVGAHQDDLEIMAFEGILACYQQPDKWFTGVVVTNGSGSPRAGIYADYSGGDMRAVRRVEQKKAAMVGEYAAQALLDYPSSAVKDKADSRVTEDLRALLEAAKPRVVYAHNLADKHDTHVGTTLRLIEAIRKLPADARPEKLYGCEVWRDLDWMIDEDKVAFDVSGHDNLQAALLGIFDSQVAGGKRYDLATLGRRRAHATYHASHGVDESTGLTFGMDLTPLIEAPDTCPLEYVTTYLKRFEDEIAERFGKLT